MPNLLVTATTRYDPKGLNKAKKDIKGFDKSIKSLGKAFAGVFAAQKVLAFGKASVKAFAADDKAARMLGNTLNNVGAAYAATNVEDFIAQLQSATGVLDDSLRPALQILLTATGDVTKSQGALALALDVSQATGKDLSAVSTALAKGFQGNTTALSKMGGAVSKATLATGDMDKITAELSAKYKGSALTAAAGYSGQMDKLAVASANAKEIIGKGLLNAISNLSDAKGVDNLATSMQDTATYLADVIRGMGILLGQVNKLPGGFKLDVAMIPIVGAYLSILKQTGKSTVRTGYGQQSPGDRNKAIAANAKLARQKTEELNALTAKNKATAEELKLKKDQAALDELKKKFDLERIGILAALAAATDAETKARLQAMLAILDEDAAAIKLASQNLAKVMADKAIAEAAAQASLLKFGTAIDSASSQSTGFTTELTKSAGDLAMVVSGMRYAAQGAAQMATMLAGINLPGVAGTSFNAGIAGGNTVADSISGARYAAQAAAQMADAIKALEAATAAATAATANKPVPVIKVVTDPTVVVTLVQDAIIDNGRAGNILFPPGSLLSPI